MGEIALVEHHDAAAQPCQPPGDRHADEPAADHGKIIFVGGSDL